jgi:hypothetical protein
VLHRLRGGCRQLGAVALAARCEGVRATEPAAERTAALRALRACYAATLAELREGLKREGGTDGATPGA